MRSEGSGLAHSIPKAQGQARPDLSNDPLIKFVKKSLANYYIINSGLALNKVVRFFYSILSLLAYKILGFIMAFFKQNVFYCFSLLPDPPPVLFHSYTGLISLHSLYDINFYSVPRVRVVPPR